MLRTWEGIIVVFSPMGCRAGAAYPGSIDAGRKIRTDMVERLLFERQVDALPLTEFSTLWMTSNDTTETLVVPFLGAN